MPTSKSVYKAYKRAIPDAFVPIPVPSLEDGGKAAVTHHIRLKKAVFLRKRYTAECVAPQDRDIGHARVIEHMESDISTLGDMLANFNAAHSDALQEKARLAQESHLAAMAHHLPKRTLPSKCLVPNRIKHTRRNRASSHPTSSDPTVPKQQVETAVLVVNQAFAILEFAQEFSVLFAQMDFLGSLRSSMSPADVDFAALMFLNSSPCRQNTIQNIRRMIQSEKEFQDKSLESPGLPIDHDHVIHAYHLLGRKHFVSFLLRTLSDSRKMTTFVSSGGDRSRVSEIDVSGSLYDIWISSRYIRQIWADGPEKMLQLSDEDLVVFDQVTTTEGHEVHCSEHLEMMFKHGLTLEDSDAALLDSSLGRRFIDAVVQSPSCSFKWS